MSETLRHPPVLETFHPVVRTWFERNFPEGPTEPQAEGWPAIARDSDTLIAAPTGSGKTLSAFLVCIDRLYKEAEQANRRDFRLGDGVDDEEETLPGTQVVYVSPLKALGVDIKKNLDEPLAQIADVAKELGPRRTGRRAGRGRKGRLQPLVVVPSAGDLCVSPRFSFLLQRPMLRRIAAHS
ncbi:MAG: DEAD/DEAH box helicase [Myxococcota bacterium]|jgi:ATP-dependent Lhr-like helicase|nr:DEAD/DEAH box helicase [Myxococcota bacterium]